MSVETAENLPTARIPHPPWRIPLVGDVVGLSVRNPVQHSIRLGRELGPIFEQRIFGMRFVFAAGADLVAELGDESRFAKHLGPEVLALRGIAGDGLFTAFNDEPNWARAHNLLAPAFTKPAMRSYHRTMCDVAGELVAHWDRRAGERIDVAADMTKVTLETIGRTGFSYTFDSFERAEPHPFVRSMVAALTHALRTGAITSPLLRKLVLRRADRRAEADRAYLAKVVDDVICARREEGHEGHDDLLELMLRAARAHDPNAVDEVNIRHQVLTFLVAGHETTSGALSFALYYLATHPEVLARARSEVDEVWGGASPEFEQVAKLRYVRRALDESLRLWPTVPVYAREATADTVLGGRYPMRKGDAMMVLIHQLHRDPVWGEDPERFDPDRFLPARGRARPGHAYRPFGTGERACIGRQFAIHEALLVLGTILANFDIAADSGYQPKVTERLTIMPDGFTLTARRRLRPRD